jgi:predicted kinase
MLRAGINNPGDPLILMGLSEGNVNRLRNGRPIVADIRSFGVDLPGRIAVVYGKTEADIEAEMRGHGLIGPETRGLADAKVDQEVEARRRHEKILILTVGLPRAGKSTWARSQCHPIVNPDSIRLAIHGQRFVASAEGFVWATARAMVRALFLAGHDTVILDATNLTRKRREEWKSLDWGLFFHEVPTSQEECVVRAAGDAEMAEVICRMAGQREPLGADEQRW